MADATGSIRQNHEWQLSCDALLAFVQRWRYVQHNVVTPHLPAPRKGRLMACRLDLICPALMMRLIDYQRNTMVRGATPPVGKENDPHRLFACGGAGHMQPNVVLATGCWTATASMHYQGRETPAAAAVLTAGVAVPSRRSSRYRRGACGVHSCEAQTHQTRQTRRSLWLRAVVNSSRLRRWMLRIRGACCRQPRGLLPGSSSAFFHFHPCLWLKPNRELKLQAQIIGAGSRFFFWGVLCGDHS